VLGKSSDTQSRLINFAPVGAQVSCDRRQQGGLSTTIAPEESDPLATLNDAINPAQEGPATAGEFQAGKSDHAGRAERSSNAII
jgi:hypothetical protein